MNYETERKPNVVTHNALKGCEFCPVKSTCGVKTAVFYHSEKLNYFVKMFYCRIETAKQLLDCLELTYAKTEDIDILRCQQLFVKMCCQHLYNLISCAYKYESATTEKETFSDMRDLLYEMLERVQLTDWYKIVFDDFSEQELITEE